MDSQLTSLLPVREIYLQITLLEMFMYGIYTALFVVTVYAMTFGKRSRQKTPLYPPVFLMYILATIHVATRWFLIKTAFIDHGDSPVATLSYLLVNPLWLVVLAGVALTTNTLIADCVLIWRCWTIWGRNLKIIILPVLCTIPGAVLGYLSIVEQARYVLHPELDRDKFIDYGTPYFGLSLATTALATLFIIVRIVAVSRLAHLKDIYSHGRGYSKVIEMIVESAALYSVSVIVFLPFLVSGTFNDGYPQAILVQMTGIAPTLIVARVSFGLSRPDDTWEGKSSNSKIIFNPDSVPESTTAALRTTKGTEGSESTASRIV